MDEIANAMKDLETYTCVRFNYRTTENDFVNLYNGDGCHSAIGRVGGQQDVSLDSKGCLGRGTIQHELIHALGYTHMQNHADRDEYLKIHWENIDPVYRTNFEKVSAYDFGNFDTPYEFTSLMHYSFDAFSRNGQPTITPTTTYRSYQTYLGQRRSLTQGDADRINNMYNCRSSS